MAPVCVAIGVVIVFILFAGIVAWRVIAAMNRRKRDASARPVFDAKHLARENVAVVITLACRGMTTSQPHKETLRAPKGMTGT